MCMSEGTLSFASVTGAEDSNAATAPDAEPPKEDATSTGVVTWEPESIAPTETQTPAPGDAGEDEWAETPSEKGKGKIGKQQYVPTFPLVPIMRQRKDPCPLTILLIGVTGAGKSTFAAHASGADLVIGQDLDPCT